MLGKKNHEILAVLKYKPLYNISRSEKLGKKIQAAACNGVRKVYILNPAFITGFSFWFPFLSCLALQSRVSVPLKFILETVFFNYMKSRSFS
jgi:hypothetical protein